MAKLEDCPHTEQLGCSLSCIGWDIKYFGFELIMKYKLSVASPGGDNFCDNVTFGVKPEVWCW